MRSDILQNNKPIPIGFVGGGKNSWIGNTHRIASRIDGRYIIKAGVFSSDPEVSKEFSMSLGIPEHRSYSNFLEMAEKESSLEDGIKVVCICTPPSNHYEIAKIFIEKNIHIICDKPMTTNLEDAKKLYELIKKKKILFCLTHNYTGYPMVRQARQMILDRQIGDVHMVNVEYPQGSLPAMDPKFAKELLGWRAIENDQGVGLSTVVSDLATHTFHIAQYVSSLKVVKISADVSKNVKSIGVDDNVHAMLRFENKATGLLWSSFAATGGEHGLRVRVFGSKGAIDWIQDQPNQLSFFSLDGPTQTFTRASKWVSKFSMENSRVAAGHPEGFFEAFANLYTDLADAINNNSDFNVINEKKVFPNAEDGLEGLKFVYAVKKSSNNNGEWTEL
jgi:predicted dehydrogenase